MCLHNYLVDHRESNKEKEDWDIDIVLFNAEIFYTNADTLQVGNDNIRPIGRVSDNEWTMCQRGLMLQYFLCQALADHDMQMPSRSEWNQNYNTHVVML